MELWPTLSLRKNEKMNMKKWIEEKWKNWGDKLKVIICEKIHPFYAMNGN